MHLDIPHKFTKTEARSRLVAALNEAKAQAADKVKIEEERWEENMLHFAVVAEGQRITGTLEVQDNQYAVDAKLPLMLRLFEGRIERAAKEQVQQMLRGGVPQLPQ